MQDLHSLKKTNISMIRITPLDTNLLKNESYKSQLKPGKISWEISQRRRKISILDRFKILKTESFPFKKHPLQLKFWILYQDIQDYHQYLIIVSIAIIWMWK